VEDPYDWDGRVDAWEEVASSEAFQALRDAVCERAAPRSSDVVVDLGAGTGLLTLALAPDVEQVTALDISGRMLDRLAARAAAERICNVCLVEGDLRSLPLEDESATLVVSNYAFHHLDDCAKELALTEVRRILVPGGRVVICDMMFALSLDARDRALLREKVVAIAKRGPAGILRIARNAGRVAVGRWEHPAPPEEWKRMLRARGFDRVEVELLEHEAGIATAVRPSSAGVAIDRCRTRKNAHSGEDSDVSPGSRHDSGDAQTDVLVSFLHRSHPRQPGERAHRVRPSYFAHNRRLP
jgi:ubiquinone/menaquinone biosynthesis C-methylase UbiE